MKPLCLAVLGLMACAPAARPEQQQAEYTVITQTPPIGSLAYSLDLSGTVSGALDLDAPLITTHRVRVATVWLRAYSSSFQDRRWRAVILPQGQESVEVESTAGTHPFSFTVSAAPMEAMGAFTAGALVAYVDGNDNGVLDVSNSAPSADHVLASTDFPLINLGHLELEPLMFVPGTLDGSRLLVFDDPLLDLVACTLEDRFVSEGVCGVPLYVRPRVRFTARLEDERVELIVEAQPGDRITIDDEPYLVDGDFSKWAVGQHLLRVVNGRGGVFEATFTMPEPLEVVSIASAGFTPAGQPQHDVTLKQLTGAYGYSVRSNGGGGTSSNSPTLRVVNLNTRNFSAEASFHLTFHASGQFPRH